MGGFVAGFPVDIPWAGDLFGTFLESVYLCSWRVPLMTARAMGRALQTR